MNSKSNSKSMTVSTVDLVYIALCTALIAVCSWIQIPLTVPITLQTFAVFAVVGLLGTKRGTLSVLVYILLGAVGVPVFAGFSGGIGVLLGNTGGYIIGFIFSAIVTGWILDHLGKSIPVMAIAMIVGLAVCYIFGTAWFMFVYMRTSGTVGLVSVLSWCVIPFILPDAIKIALAIVVSKSVGPYVRD